MARKLPDNSKSTAVVSWKKQPIYIIDFEGNRRTGVVEYGVAILQGGEVVDCHTRLCRPREAISGKDFLFHGIRQDQAEVCEPLEEDYALFSRWRRSGPFGAHHAVTEEGLLRATWTCPPDSPDFYVPSRRVASWGPWIDTLQLYSTIYPGLQDYKLGTLIAVFGMESRLVDLAQKWCPGDRRKFHCALYDALASALLLIRLGEEPGFSDMDLAWLIQNSAGSHQAREDLRQTRLWD